MWPSGRGRRPQGSHLGPATGRGIMATLPNLFDLYFCSCRLRGGAKFPQCLSLIALGFTDQPASSELQILQDLKGLWGPAVLHSVSWSSFKDHAVFVPSIVGGFLRGRSSRGLISGTFCSKQAVNYDFPCPSCSMHLLADPFGSD